MNRILDAVRTELRAFAAEAAEAYVHENPRAFALYTVPLSEEGLRGVVAGWDVGDWDFLRDEVNALAVERLRGMAQEGRVAALTSGANSPEWRGAARSADYPLLRLMAHGEFGGALTDEVDAALAAATALPGWNAAHPPIVRCSI